jgi:hypothetical protein
VPITQLYVQNWEMLFLGDPMILVNVEQTARKFRSYLHQKQQILISITGQSLKVYLQVVITHLLSMKLADCLFVERMIKDNLDLGLIITNLLLYL